MTTEAPKPQTDKLLNAISLLDHFNADLLGRVINKMREANATLLTLTSSTIENQQTPSEQKDQFKEIVQSGSNELDASAITGLQDLLTNRSSVDSSLKSLLGLVELSILLEKRLVTFQNLFSEYQELLFESAEREKIVELFSRYGVSLNFFWKICESKSQEVFAKEIFDRLITKKTSPEKKVSG